MVVRLSHMWFMESERVSVIRQILLAAQKPKSFKLQPGLRPLTP